MHSDEISRRGFLCPGTAGSLAAPVEAYPGRIAELDRRRPTLRHVPVR